MTFLSLSKGDPAARALLQRAIRARYGLRPLLVESMRMRLTTRQTGPLGLPLVLRVNVAYVGTTHWRRDQVSAVLGLPLGKMTESFDGGAYYRVRGRQVEVSTDPLVVSSFRRRLWAEQAMLLTPLSEEGVILKAVDEQTFQAMPEANADDVATIFLNADDTVAQVEIQRYRPEDQQTLRFTLRPEGGLQALGGFVVPHRIVSQWEGAAPRRYVVGEAEANPKIPLTEFTLSPAP